MTISPLHIGAGPVDLNGNVRGWAYVKVHDGTVNPPAGISVSDQVTGRTDKAVRWPWVASVNIAGFVYEKIQMDLAITPAGAPVPGWPTSM